MFSDKYLFNASGRRIYRFDDARQIVSSAVHCPICFAKSDTAKVLEETGDTAHYMVYCCTCGTLYNDVN